MTACLMRAYGIDSALLPAICVIALRHSGVYDTEALQGEDKAPNRKSPTAVTHAWGASCNGEPVITTECQYLPLWRKRSRILLADIRIVWSKKA